MPLVSAPRSPHPAYHPLTVVRVDHLTPDAVAVTFAVPRELASVFAFLPGQHVTLRADLGGELVRRPYSLCLSRGQARSHGVLRVAVGEVPGGRMSPWLVRSVRPGDTLDVLAPMGDLVCPLERALSLPRDHVGIASGSGITPILSLLATALEEEPESSCVLVLGSREVSRIMFRAELEEMATSHPGRFRVVHVLGDAGLLGDGRSEGGDAAAPGIEYVPGRIDAELTGTLVREYAGRGRAVEWYVAGPPGLVDQVWTALPGFGADPSHIHHEAFTTAE